MGKIHQIQQTLDHSFNKFCCEVYMKFGNKGDMKSRGIMLKMKQTRSIFSCVRVILERQKLMTQGKESQST